MGRGRIRSTNRYTAHMVIRPVGTDKFPGHPSEVSWSSWPTLVGFPAVVSCFPRAFRGWLLVASQTTRRNRKKLKKKNRKLALGEKAATVVPPLGISLILLNSVYRGDRRGSRGALDLQGACFLFRNGIWSGVDVWPGTLSGEILPPCAVLPMADVGSGGWFRAPSVGSARMNTGCQFSFGDESPATKNSGRALTGGRRFRGMVMNPTLDLGPTTPKCHH